MANYDLHEFIDDEGNVYNFSDDEAQRVASSALDLAEKTRLAANGIGETCEGYVWLGANIATKFAEEIGSTDPITWLKNRASAGNFDGLEIGMYLPVTLNDGKNTQMKYQISGFDQYYGVGDTVNGHMITLVPAIVYPENVKFNSTNDNNGSADETTPWRNSELFEWMNTTFYNYLPAAWKSALKDIRVYQAIRYSESGKLTDDNGGAWISLGKVWAPSEIEVWGSWRRGTSLNTPTGIACTDKKLPIFENGRTVIRSRIYWWVRVACAGSSSHACFVHNYGNSNANAATYEWVRPLPCFHIG